MYWAVKSLMSVIIQEGHLNASKLRCRSGWRRSLLLVVSVRSTSTAAGCSRCCWRGGGNWRCWWVMCHRILEQQVIGRGTGRFCIIVSIVGCGGCSCRWWALRLVPFRNNCVPTYQVKSLKWFLSGYVGGGAVFGPSSRRQWRTSSELIYIGRVGSGRNRACATGTGWTSGGRGRCVASYKSQTVAWLSSW